jgi:hypothetical protein
MPDERRRVVVDFLDAWRYCPVASSPDPSPQCLENAATQLLDALAAADSAFEGLPWDGKQEAIHLFHREREARVRAEERIAELEIAVKAAADDRVEALIVEANTAHARAGELETAVREIFQQAHAVGNAWIRSRASAVLNTTKEDS